MIEMHVYYCGSCNVKFGVDAECEDQELVVCPICQKDDALENAGYGVTTITVEPDDEPE